MSRFLMAMAFCLGMGLLPSLSLGQIQRSGMPHQGYYQSFGEYYLADYKDSIRNFSRGANSAYRFGTQRFLDSICFWTHIGESYYHLGEYAKAMEMYEQSLQLYVYYQTINWQGRIKLPPNIQSDNNALQQARINWGAPNRKGFVRLPNSFSVLFGRLDAELTLQTGGVVQNAEFKQLDVAEIMRCTALCLHRRRVILGPTAKYDPFTAQLVSNLNTVGSGDGSMLGAMNGILLGVAYASNEDWDKATRKLTSSIQMVGGLEHPLSSIGLLELANIAVEKQSYVEAAKLALEASYSAAVYNQFDLVEESLSLGTQVHLMNSKTPYAPLENAIQWANSNRARMMQASLTVRLAECLAEGGQADLAVAVLRQTKSSINSRNSLGNAVVSARLKYVSALAQFLNSNFQRGMTELAAALKHFQKGSFWIYRLNLANSLVARGGVNQRQADLLYTSLLRDPNELDWKKDPFEAIAFLASPHLPAMETWFDILIDRKNIGRAIELGDLIRRHRFFTSLPLGGRLLSFRWVMHAPEEALSTLAIGQRQEFFQRNRAYKTLTDRAELIRDSLRALPLNPSPNSKEENEQLKLLKELETISIQQESILASYALRREVAEMAFPPQIPLAQFKDRLADNQVVLNAVLTGSGYHLMLMEKETVNYLGLFRSREIQKDVSTILKNMKISEIAFEVSDIQDDGWVETGTKWYKKVFGDSYTSRWDEIDELIVVPDGQLWYLPMEALPVLKSENEIPADPLDSKFLGERVHVRYSPTLFLSAGVQRPWQKIDETVVIAKSILSRQDDYLAQSSFDNLSLDIQNAVKLDQPIRKPTSLFGFLFDQLIVWGEIDLQKKSTWTLNPTQIDQSKNGTTLFDWMGLPWWGPQYVDMSAFHSDAGAGLRNRRMGSDLFLTSVGLMASGTRTVLISRWAAGGRSSLNLSSQFAKNLATLGPKQALRNAEDFIRSGTLDYNREPRLRVKPDDPPVSGRHPYFWAAPMLMSIPDSGIPAGQQPGEPDLSNDDPQSADENLKLPDEPMNKVEPPEIEVKSTPQLKPDPKKESEASKPPESTKTEPEKPKPRGLFAKPKKKKSDPDKSGNLSF